MVLKFVVFASDFYMKILRKSIYSVLKNISLAFTRIYNAITGNADAVEENGEAVRLYQNFWSSTRENVKRGTNLVFHLRKCEKNVKLALTSWQWKSIFVLACVSRKWLFYRLSGASVILSGIVKQCQICRKCRKFVVKKWWEMESANKMNAGSQRTGRSDPETVGRKRTITG